MHATAEEIRRATGVHRVTAVPRGHHVPGRTRARAGRVSGAGHPCQQRRQAAGVGDFRDWDEAA